MLGCSLISFFDTYLKQKASVKVRNDIRLDTMDHALRLHQAYNDRIHTGDLLARFTSDNQAVGEAAGNVIMGLIRNPLLATCAFIYLLDIHWPLALITICVGPAMILTGKMFGESMRRKGVRLQETMGRGTSYLQDVLGSGVLVQNFRPGKKDIQAVPAIQHGNRGNRAKPGQNPRGCRGHVAGDCACNLHDGHPACRVFCGQRQPGSRRDACFYPAHELSGESVCSLPALWSSMQQALAGAERIFR
ncbi:ABC transporter transmembrane domain-containing protein [Paenibacillus sp. JTLBN-2024]